MGVNALAVSGVPRAPFRGWVSDYLADESGATMIEYAVVCSTIAMAIVGTASLIGTQVSQVFQTVAGFF
ncbi:MAG: Flp family type IVb pilin [Oricola sp.]|nr:Flp family type IVb pilin [Oricola sp.]